MIKLVLLVVAAVIVFLIITQPQQAGQHMGEFLPAVLTWIKEVLASTFKLIKDTIEIFQKVQG